MKKLLLILTILISFTSSFSFADVPQLINYQGRLTDTDGGPLTGSHTLSFRIYNAATGGSNLWGPQEFQTVMVTDGHFNVILGPVDTSSRSITSAFNEAAAYLQISVDGGAILPRQQILSAPYAISVSDNSISESKIIDSSVSINKIKHQNHISPVLNLTTDPPQTGQTLYTCTVTGNDTKIIIVRHTGTWYGGANKAYIRLSPGGNNPNHELIKGGTLILALQPGTNSIQLWTPFSSSGQIFNNFQLIIKELF